MHLHDARHTDTSSLFALRSRKSENYRLHSLSRFSLVSSIHISIVAERFHGFVFHTDSVLPFAPGVAFDMNVALHRNVIGDVPI
jgi:hypothetical protein